MTQTRTLIALIVGLIAGLLIAAGIAQLAQQVTTEPASTATVVEEQAVQQPAGPATSALGTDFGIVHAALGDADWTQAQVDEVLLVADRVCEGSTAEVPVTVLEQTVADRAGITMPAAHDFVALALATRC